MRALTATQEVSRCDLSRFFSEKFNDLEPYVPGEQPKDKKYVKLNTNESPFSVSEKARQKAIEALADIELYPDPDCTVLREKTAAYYGVCPENIFIGNGSDEVLYFAFAAFCDESRPAVFADITYGFYPVFAQINNVPYEIIALDPDLSIPADVFKKVNGTVVIANPNAPTGLYLEKDVIEEIVKVDPERIVIIDEAYIDFGGTSAASLTLKYDNLLVVQTFSKSRSMAGARLGLAIGNEALINDLGTIKYSTNPYNVNRLTQALGAGVMEDDGYTEANCRKIMENREYLTGELEKRGFYVIPSLTNFVLAKNAAISGKELYLKLKEKGVLVRYFDKDRLYDYVRITIGTRQQLDILLEKTDEIMQERSNK